MTADLDRQMHFLMEADRLKSVERANVLMDLSRPENAAEHSWHVALYALVLAPYADVHTDLARVIAMILIHDLVEIDAGDMPIDQPHDPEAHAKAERAAADRLFGLLPVAQGQSLHALWTEFEAGHTPDARFAKRLDHIQPILQVLQAPEPRADHMDVVRDNLTTGRAARLAMEWPEMHQALSDMVNGAAPRMDQPMARRLAFLREADRLKSVNRATLLGDASRRENSAEHSWHVALFALILGKYAPNGADIPATIRMLLLHDLVEIDAGDNPIFGTVDAAAQAAEEDAAAQRIFGLLPPAEGADLIAQWRTFEANETPEARFGKSLDRFSPPNQNLAAGGASWIEYSVSYETFETRVASKINAGAPVLWHWLEPHVRKFFREKLGQDV